MPYAKDALKSFCQFRINADELERSYTEPEDGSFDDDMCNMTLLDLAEAVYNLKDEKNFHSLWLDTFLDLAAEGVICTENPYGIEDPNGLPDEYSVLNEGVEILMASEDGTLPDDTVMEEVWQLIDTFQKNRMKPLEERELTASEMMHYILFWHSRNEAPEGIYRDLYKDYLDILCESEFEEALYIKGRETFEGSPVYEKDWHEAKACYEKLFELTDDPSLAWPLACIAYYSSTPDYHKAYEYSALGTVAGIAECKCLIADLYMKGQGVKANRKAAVNMITQLYEEEMDAFLCGFYDCCLADAAYRMGELAEEKGIYGEGASSEKAYYFYLQAQCALQKRMETGYRSLDQALALKIAAAIKETGAQQFIHPDQDEIKGIGLDRLLNSLSFSDHLMEVKAEEKDHEKQELTFRFLQKEEENRPMILVTLPELGYCELLEEVKVTLEDVRGLFLEDEENHTAVFDTVSDNRLFRYGKLVGGFFGTAVFSLDSDEEKEENNKLSILNWERS